MKKRLIWGLLAALPMAANASGSSGTTTIGSITVDTWNQMISIVGTTTWSNPDACGSSSFVILSFSNANYKDVLAAAMMASASGKTVSFFLNGCVASPWGNAPVVTAISVY